MKTLITYLFICMSLFTLKAQTSPADNGCINFDEFNICYSVEYRPEDEKVGTICSIEDLLLNKSKVVVESYSMYLTTGGQLFSDKENSRDNFIYKIRNYLHRMKDENSYLLLDLIINYEGKSIKFPPIGLKKCK